MAGGVAGNSPTSSAPQRPNQEVSSDMNKVYQDRYIGEFNGMIPVEVKEVNTESGEPKLLAVYADGRLGHFEGQELIGKFIQTPEYRQFLEGKLGQQ